MLRWLVPLLSTKLARRVVRERTFRHWRIAIRVGAKPVPGPSARPVMSGFRWIDAPAGHAYADPFVIDHHGERWVFFEDFEYAKKRGKISCAPVRDAGIGEVLSVLERPYHISYPCMFRDGETWYMIPETMSARTVELYRCTRFPDQWRQERVILRAAVVDTTVWVEDGVFWFFVTYIEPRGGAVQLWLYSASSLEESWVPHPANPIVTDIRCARGAGAVFRYEGRLFRPSQDDSGEYGRSITLNEIVVLDRQSYREEPRAKVNPATMKDLVGTHTYGIAGDVEFIDGKTRARLAN